MVSFLSLFNKTGHGIPQLGWFVISWNFLSFTLLFIIALIFNFLEGQRVTLFIQVISIKREPLETSIRKKKKESRHSGESVSAKTDASASVQDLNSRPCSDNAHLSVLVHEMKTVELSEIPSHILTWKPTDFLGWCPKERGQA
jgi:hypothetical protein